MKSYRYCVVFLCVLFSIANALAQTWLQKESTQYTIYYVSEYAEDVEFVRAWLDHTERLMLEKYGLQRHGYHISVYLHPAPARRAGVGLAALLCCSQNTGEIHYLTPSAPAWEEAQRNGSRTSLGMPFDDDYHAAVLVHEYITVGYTRISADKPRGFRYYSAPAWFYQGLEQYDGTFHSTEANRTAGYERLLDHADRNLRGKIYCCRTLDLERQTFGSSDVYNGGNLLMKFMADQYGEEFHVDLLKSEQPTFTQALEEELALRGQTVSGTFDDLQQWFALERGEEVATMPMTEFALHFAHSAAGGGWRTDLVLLNAYRNRTAQATVNVFGQDGAQRAQEPLNLEELSAVEWTLPEGEAIETGGVVVSSPEKLAGFLRFRHEDGAATSVQSAPVESAFMVPVSSEAEQVGVAVYNADDKDLTVVLRMGERALYKEIPAQGKIAGFVDEYFPGSSESILTVQTSPSGGRMTVLALEMINGNLVTLPAAPLN